MTEETTNNKTVADLAEQLNFSENMLHDFLVELTATQGRLIREHQETIDWAGNVYLIRFLIGLAEKGCITFDPDIIRRSNVSALLKGDWPDARLVVEAIQTIDEDRCRAEARGWLYPRK